ncbi:hypothetical protein [Floridanema aerugineum]|uniref:Uncharacterized protein n=1 Tax=Floridaenema aerugineum BLCC-F46 TaxID=3153654 RepID=A0ABV4X1S9_9CYAN
MRRIRFLVLGLVSFVAAIFGALLVPGSWVNRVFSTLVCGIFSFNSMVCTANWGQSSQRVVAATPPAVENTIFDGFSNLLAQRDPSEFGDPQPSTPSPQQSNPQAPPFPQDPGPNFPVRPDFDRPDSSQPDNKSLDGMWLYSIYESPSEPEPIAIFPIRLTGSNPYYRQLIESLGNQPKSDVSDELIITWVGTQNSPSVWAVIVDTESGNEIYVSMNKQMSSTLSSSLKKILVIDTKSNNRKTIIASNNPRYEQWLRDSGRKAELFKYQRQRQNPKFSNHIQRNIPQPVRQTINKLGTNIQKARSSPKDLVTIAYTLGKGAAITEWAIRNPEKFKQCISDIKCAPSLDPSPSLSDLALWKESFDQFMSRFQQPQQPPQPQQTAQTPVNDVFFVGNVTFDKLCNKKKPEGYAYNEYPPIDDPTRGACTVRKRVGSGLTPPLEINFNMADAVTFCRETLSKHQDPFLREVAGSASIQVSLFHWNKYKEKHWGCFVPCTENIRKERGCQKFNPANGPVSN